MICPSGHHHKPPSRWYFRHIYISRYLGNVIFCCTYLSCIYCANTGVGGRFTHQHQVHYYIHLLAMVYISRLQETSSAYRIEARADGSPPVWEYDFRAGG